MHTSSQTRKLSAAEAANYIGVSKSWLDKLRVLGGGPIFIQLGRRVVYDYSDLDDWVRACRRKNTSGRVSA